MHLPICYHEAGHAVMAAWLGAEVVYVTIEPDRDHGPRRDGDAAVRWTAHRLSSRQLCERELMTVLAGPVAEMIHTEQRRGLDRYREWAADWELASHFAGLLVKPPAARLAMLDQLTDKLFAWMSQAPFWQSIAEVADLLDAHETIEGDCVAECVQRWLGAS